MAEGTTCKNCERDCTSEALGALSEAQYGGYDSMSIQYAQHWSEKEVDDFLNAYICNQCKEERAKPLS